MTPLTWHSFFHSVEGIAAVATIGLAVGTVAIAVVTYLTARRTKALASETNRLVDATAQLAKVGAAEVEVSGRALQVNIKPLLGDVPSSEPRGMVGFLREDNGTRITVPFRNVGRGTALVKKATMHWPEAGAAVTPTTYEGTVTVLLVPPDGWTTAVFNFAGQERRLRGIVELRKFSVRLRYTDSDDGQAEITQLDLHRHTPPGADEPEDWRVEAVLLFRDEYGQPHEDEPYAVSRPAIR